MGQPSLDLVSAGPDCAGRGIAAQRVRSDLHDVEPAPVRRLALNEPPVASSELFPSVGASETESHLRRLLDVRGIGLPTGEPGCGKTSACRRVTDGLHPGLYRVCYCPLTTGSILDVY